MDAGLRRRDDEVQYLPHEGYETFAVDVSGEAVAAGTKMASEMRAGTAS